MLFWENIICPLSVSRVKFSDIRVHSRDDIFEGLFCCRLAVTQEHTGLVPETDFLSSGATTRIHEYATWPVLPVYCQHSDEESLWSVCHYFPSQSGKRAHSRIHNSTRSAPVAANTADDDVDDDEGVNDDADTDATTHQSTAAAGTDAPGTDEHMPVVHNLFDWL